MGVDDGRLPSARFCGSVHLKNLLSILRDGASKVSKTSVVGPFNDTIIKARRAVDEDLIGCKVGPFDELPELPKVFL